MTIGAGQWIDWKTTCLVAQRRSKAASNYRNKKTSKISLLRAFIYSLSSKNNSQQLLNTLLVFRLLRGFDVRYVMLEY